MNGRTPGPWQVEEGALLVWGDCDSDDPTTRAMGYPVAKARIGSAIARAVRPSYGEAQANARLIAAAPDLLAACKALVGSVTQETERGRVYALGELSSAVDAAKAAIAKAEQP